MEISRQLILLILGVLIISFLTAFISQLSKKGRDPNIFSGIIYEQPVLDGRSKTISINNKRIYLTRYTKLEQGDYINLDFRTCVYSKKYDNYYKCLIYIDKSKESYFLKDVLRLRNIIIYKAKTQLPSPHDLLLLAMTIGYEDDLPESLTTKLREIGAIHMLVVSGYNVSLVLNSSGVLLMRLPRWVYIIFSVLLLILFVFLTGFDAPIVRSVIMGTFIIFSRAYSRPTAALYLLILSAIVMASWNTEYLSNISFQLSFSATFGVIISGYILKNTNNFISDLGASVGANLFVIPIISFYFGTVSLLGIVSSILLGWMVPLITYLGFLIYIFNLSLINLVFVVITDLFFALVGFIYQYSYLNMEYSISLKGLTLYYAFMGLLIMFIYRLMETISNENK